MAEIAVSLARDTLLPLLREKANLLIGVHKAFAEIDKELESIQGFIKDAERKAADEGDNASEGSKIWVKQVREVAFRIEDVIGEYMIHVGEQSRDPGCEALLFEIANLVKNLIPCLRTVSEIQEIKSCIRGIKERSERYDFKRSSEQESSSFKWQEHRTTLPYIEEAKVVGFEDERDELIGWLEDKATERMVISVVGMGGLGKTTLANMVFDNQKKARHFDCHAWITVSQSYTVEGLLKNMLELFYRERKEKPQVDYSKMNRQLLIDEVRNYLEQKRYLLLFDDVWKVDFFGEIESAVYDNKKRSRILITSRSIDVVQSCKKYASVRVHKLQPLPPGESWELFCKKAFDNGCCPEELKGISSEIIEKCKGLPLAIVAVGGLLCIKEKSAFELQKLSRNLRSELDGIRGILALSYDDLPYYLKSCLLYFGKFPEDYEVKSGRLIRQWIAEGFVKHDKWKTLEEVGEQYLTELIHRNLLLVSSFSIDGKPRSFRVHDLLREMILGKIEDLNFCQFVTDDPPVFSGMIRRQTIATNSNDLMEGINSSHIRSLHVFRDEKLPEHFVRRIPTAYRLLKVLDFEDAPIDYVPESLGNLLHLKYLRIKETWIWNLPESIGMLQHLETFDVRGTSIDEMPREINKLKKLRHFVGGTHYLGIHMKDGIGSLAFLQTLRHVKVGLSRVHLIAALENLRQLRVLGLTDVLPVYGSTLCSSINEMQHLEKLYIHVASGKIDLHCISSLPVLRKLRLSGKLNKLPDWIPNLQNLVQLSLLYSQITDDPSKSLKNMPNLLFLYLVDAYEGKSLHFQVGGFQKLKKLELKRLNRLNCIHIDRGALPSLKEFQLADIPLLKEVPSGIHHLAKLEVFNAVDMPYEFLQSIYPDRGSHLWIIKHVPLVRINDHPLDNLRTYVITD